MTVAINRWEFLANRRNEIMVRILTLVMFRLSDVKFLVVRTVVLCQTSWNVRFESGVRGMTKVSAISGVP